MPSESPRERGMKRTSQLLLQGATMLADHCPDCAIPLVRDKQGLIFCPGCDRKAVYVSSDEEAASIESRFSSNETLNQLESVLIGKVNRFTTELASTNNSGEIISILKIIDGLLATLYKIYHINEKSG